MTTHATATFAIKTWDEQPFSEVEGGPKLVHASMTESYQGDIE